MINALASTDIGESYQRVLALAVTRRMREFNGAYLPPFIIRGKSLYFAIDNVDFLEDTPTGKDTLHGTAMVAYQRSVTGETSMVPPLEFHKKGRQIDDEEDVLLELLPCEAPVLSSIA